jgi:hypothetical protein
VFPECNGPNSLDDQRNGKCRDMTRDTSIMAYNQIRESGLLTKLRWQVYECLFQHGPLGQNELLIELGTPHFKKDSIKPRFAELEKFGVIREVGKRPCRITGREVIIWDVTSNLPQKNLKPTKKQKKKNILDLMVNLGRKIPEPYRPDLRNLYKQVKAL